MTTRWAAASTDLTVPRYSADRAGPAVQDSAQTIRERIIVDFNRRWKRMVESSPRVELQGFTNGKGETKARGLAGHRCADVASYAFSPREKVAVRPDEGVGAAPAGADPH